ncbi:hypothetical protein [Nocardiopsis quinghaiensis]|uniref:hypothetical protein n=1 Tax=Nocardiopsis quinghaiensis TaxID=464995 RepID=UPI001238F311|nr:hypothetical protein [Nocardiopsis quinghaiensis]
MKPSNRQNQQSAGAYTPAADLVGLLETRHGLKVEEGSEAGRVVTRCGNQSVTVALVGGQWFWEHTECNGRRALSPLAPVEREWSVARAVAVELIEARAVE